MPSSHAQIDNGGQNTRVYVDFKGFCATHNGQPHTVYPGPRDTEEDGPAPNVTRLLHNGWP